MLLIYQTRSNVYPMKTIITEAVTLQNGQDFLEEMVSIFLIIGTSAHAVICGIVAGRVKVSISGEDVGDSLPKIEFGSAETTGISIQLRSFGAKVP